MARESADVKGRRYLTEGRLIVSQVQGPHVRATCRGDGEVYQVGHEPGRWYCDCPARTRCAHLVALGLVTVVHRPKGQTG